MTLDVCVVGGGPAGAIAAWRWRRAGLRVALFHAPLRAKPRVETLSPAGARLLRESGLDGALSFAGATASAGMLDAWSGPATFQSAIGSPWGAGWHVDRERFDAALRRIALLEGVELVDARVDRALVEDGFSFSAGGRAYRCRTLVDATGNAAVARGLGARRHVFDRQIAMSYPVAGAIAEGALAIAALPDGWCYDVPAGAATQRTVVTDKSTLASTTEARLLRSADEALGGEQQAGVHRCAVALATVTTSVKNLLLVGDAAWTLDPLSGQGLATAIAGVLGDMVPTPERVWAHVRARSILYASSRHSASAFFQNRLAACRGAEEVIRGNQVEVHGRAHDAAGGPDEARQGV